MELDKLKEKLDDQYNRLTDNEKNSISWKIHDSSSYIRNLNLHHYALAKKAYLLYS